MGAPLGLSREGVHRAATLTVVWVRTRMEGPFPGCPCAEVTGPFIARRNAECATQASPWDRFSRPLSPYQWGSVHDLVAGVALPMLAHRALARVGHARFGGRHFQRS